MADPGDMTLGGGGTGVVDAGLGEADQGAGGGEPPPPNSGVTPVEVPWADNFSLPPQDAAGFSILTPAADSRIVYVDASTGDDDTGATYTPDSPAVGPDPFAPVGPVMAFRSIDQAFAQMRDGSPDWMLLKRGEVWTRSGRLDVKSGRSATARSLIGAYGEAAPRPLIRTGVNDGIRIWQSIRYAAVMGLAFRAHHRDPADPEFVGFDNVESASGFRSYTADAMTPNATILIEDSSFTFYSNNNIQGMTPTEDFVVRRCLIANNYSTTNHSQGLYSKGASVLLEENVFDHNGWYRQSYVELNDRTEGQATYYNHNTYFSNAHDVLFRRNIFLRASSMGNKFTANPSGMQDEVMVENVLVDNNLYVEGEIGVSAGGNTDHGNGYRWRNILLMHNVFLAIGHGRPTNRSLGWGIEAKDWDGGAVGHNYFVHYGNAEVGNIYALTLNGHMRDVDVFGNVMHGLGSARYAVSLDRDPKERLTFSENQLQFAGHQMRLIDSDYLAPGTFSDNVYFTDNDARPFTAGGDGGDFAAWQAAVGDEGSRFEALDYVDGDRTIETYMVSLGEEGTLEAFVREARAQSKQNWRPAYTAAVVNDYVRRGYELAEP